MWGFCRIAFQPYLSATNLILIHSPPIVHVLLLATANPHLSLPEINKISREFFIIVGERLKDNYFQLCQVTH